MIWRLPNWPVHICASLLAVAAVGLPAIGFTEGAVWFGGFGAAWPMALGLIGVASAEAARSIVETAKAARSFAEPGADATGSWQRRAFCLAPRGNGMRP